MLSAAFSDSYLPSVGLPLMNEPTGSNAGNFNILGGGAMDDRRLLSPEDSLIPPLSGQVRHPSAPHLASMLTTSLEKNPSDAMFGADEDVCVCVCVSVIYTRIMLSGLLSWIIASIPFFVAPPNLSA